MQGEFISRTTSRRDLLRAAAGVSAMAVAGSLLAGEVPAAAASIVHPGMISTSSDLSRMASEVNANAQPWTADWDVLIANSEAQSTWTPNAVATIYRGSGTPENYQLLYDDIAAAYQNALRWKIQGITAYADAASKILNAWSNTLTAVDGTADRFLAVGIYGYEFANACEIMRGYSGFDLAAAQKLMLNGFYPQCHSFLTTHNGAYDSNYWASWDLCVMCSVLATGILCDDQAKIDEAITYFQTGVGMGSILNAIPDVYSSVGLAQWVEICRDQGHTMLGVGLMATFCEMAWHQGYDMYGYSSNRFMQAAEYVAQYNLGETVPFTDYYWFYGAPGVWSGSTTYTAVSIDSRGQVRPIWAQIYNHYAIRKGLFVPNSAAMAKVVEPDGGGGDYGSTSGGYDHLGFSTLVSTQQASATLPVGSKISLESINYPGYYAVVQSDSLGYLDPVSSSSTSTVKSEATFTVVSGLADSKGYSLRAPDGRYLRHYAFRIELSTSDGTTTFNEDATFYALHGAASGYVRLVSHNYPGRCIRHRDFQLWVDPYDLVGATFPDDSSFLPTTSWA